MENCDNNCLLVLTEVKQLKESFKNLESVAKELSNSLKQVIVFIQILVHQHRCFVSSASVQVETSSQNSWTTVKKKNSLKEKELSSVNVLGTSYYECSLKSASPSAPIFILENLFYQTFDVNKHAPTYWKKSITI